MKYRFSFILLILLGNQAWGAADKEVNQEVEGFNPQLQWNRSLRPVLQARLPAAIPSEVNSKEVVSDVLHLSSRPADMVPQKWSLLISDKTLYRSMRRWAQDAGYQLLWQIDRDYPIEVSVEFKSSFREALEQVMAGVALTDYPIQTVINPSARVLRVVRHLDDGRR